MINVVLRWDDYSNITSTAFEERLIEELQRREIPCTMAVVPFSLSDKLQHPATTVALRPEKVAMLRNTDRDVIDLALHGYCHQSVKGRRTEFASLSLKVQRDKIKSGRDLLEDLFSLPIRTFVPPWNSYDSKTLHVLEDLQFTALSAWPGKGTHSGTATKLKYVPMTCGVLQLRGAVDIARRMSRDSEVIVGLVFHNYDFRELGTRRGVLNLPSFLDLLESLRVQEDVKLLSISRVLGSAADLSIERYRNTASIPVGLIPRFLDREGSTRVYYDTELGRRFKSRLVLRMALWYSWLAAIGYTLGRLASGIPTFLYASGCAIVILGVIIVVRSGQARCLGYRSAMALVTLAGAGAGLLARGR